MENLLSVALCLGFFLLLIKLRTVDSLLAACHHSFVWRTRSFAREFEISTKQTAQREFPVETNRPTTAPCIVEERRGERWDDDEEVKYKNKSPYSIPTSNIISEREEKKRYTQQPRVEQADQRRLRDEIHSRALSAYTLSLPLWAPLCATLPKKEKKR